MFNAHNCLKESYIKIICALRLFFNVRLCKTNIIVYTMHLNIFSEGT